MQAQIELIRTYLRMAWLYRWIGTAMAVFICIAGWIAVQALPNQYSVSAKIYLDSRSMLRPLLKGIAYTNSMLSDTALILSQTLITRPNMEQVARKADLDLEAKTSSDFDDIVDRLLRDIDIKKTSREHIYSISYTDEVPKKAKAVVDELLNTFLETSLGDSRRETAVTQRFLEEQIAEYEKRLIEAEERVKEFKQRNVGIMPGSQGGYFQRLQDAHTQLEQAKLDLQESIRRRDQLQEQAKSGGGGFVDPFAEFGFDEFDGGGFDAESDPEIVEIDARIQNLETRIDDMLITYTEKYPDVIFMRLQIRELKSKRKRLLKEIAARPAPETDSFEGPSIDPFKQQMKLEVAAADANVAAMQARVEEFNRRIESLEQKVDVVPEVEAELVRLNRDYEINRRQYRELLERREQAYMAQEADQTEDDVKIKIIEPPRTPLEASGPPRNLLASIVLLLGLAAGAAASFALSLLKPRFVGVQELKEVSGLPVLGTVSMAASTVHRRQRTHEIAAFGAVVASLFLIYLGQIMLSRAGIDLHDKLSSVIGAIA